MASTRELIRELHDKRVGLRKQQEAVFAEMEGDLEGEGNAERQAKFDAIDKDIQSYGERITNLTAMLENEQAAEKDRERFAGILKTDGEVLSEDHNLEDRLRTWMRAGLPDAEVYAPKAITVVLEGWQGSRDVEKHDLTIGVTTAGGFTVPTGFVRQLQEHLVENTTIRQTNVQVLTTTGGETLPYPKTTSHGTNAAIIAEAGAFTEADPAFGQVSLGAFKYGKLLQVSSELVEDTAVDLLGYLARAAGLSVALGTGAHYATGTGTGQPEGIANAAVAGKTGATGQTLTVIANDLVDLFHSLVSGYRTRGFWVMNDLSAAVVRKIRDDTGGTGLGNFLWQPGLQAGFPDTIFGRPVLTDPGIAVMAANAFSIAFGDFSSYFVIRDVNRVDFVRSDDFAFANDLVSFRVRFRTDSKQLINGSAAAVKWYRNSAT